MRKNLLLLLFCVLISLSALARDFEYTYEGQTITYTVIDEETKTCGTKRGTLIAELDNGHDVYIPGNEVFGTLILPAAPKDGDTEYRLIEISNGSFYGCSGLTSIQLPSPVEEIRFAAFFGCSGLTSISVLGKELPVKFSDSFEEVNMDVELSITLEAIPSYFETEWILFGNIHIQDSDICISTISDNSIYYRLNPLDRTATIVGVENCSNIQIPEVVTNNTDPDDTVSYVVSAIGYKAFENSEIEKVEFSPTSRLEVIRDWAFINSALSSISLPESVRNIGNYIFMSCKNLANIKIGNGLKYISQGMFSECSGLPLIELPRTVTSIGWSAFEGCISLVSVEIPNSVASIGEEAFSGCIGLTVIDLPNSVTSIQSGAFKGCSGLTTFKIPNLITSIEHSTFQDCSCLTSVEIPNSVTSIGSYAFQSCSSLTSIELPNSVTSIGSGAFKGCSGLTSVEIPNSVTLIGRGAFWGCSGLTSIELPNSVTSIHPEAFKGCSGLTSFKIPNLVTRIENSTFGNCSGLTSVEIPNSVTSIGSNAFQSCSGLTYIELPNSLTSIESAAFVGCSGLTSVEIPNSVTSIERNAWGKCKNITHIICMSQEPVEASDNIFENDVYEAAFLYVPKNCTRAYLSVSPWRNFHYIAEGEFDAVDMISGESADGIDYTQPYEVYNLNGVKVGDSKDHLAMGIYIVRQGNVALKISVKD